MYRILKKTPICFMIALMDMLKVTSIDFWGVKGKLAAAEI